jgi:serine/threonine-protein kinase
MTQTIRQPLSHSSIHRAHRPMQPPPVERIGPWQLVRLVAEGELACVYQARPVDAAGRPAGYALKVLRSQWEENPEAIACMQREATVGRSIAHPHLVPILASHTAEPPFYVVMPWLTGSTLATRLAAGFRPSIPLSLWIVRQVAEALEALHAIDHVHADIKPANIFLSPQMHVTLLDLGFARRADEIGTAADRCVLGTIAYMAPETITSLRHADIRSDFYSLGVTFYELLTGRLPFVGSDLGQIVRQHRQQRPVAVRRLIPGIPKEVARLASELLSKEPLRRPQTPRELIDRLVRLEIDTLGQR